MQPDPSSDEQTAAALSMREQWRLLLWMEAHPRALLEDTQAGQQPAHPPDACRLSPVAYAVGLVVGTVWVLVRRWW